MNKQILRKVILAGLFFVPFIPFLVSGSLFFPFITTKAFAWRIIVEVIFALWIILAALEPEYRPKKSIILYCLMAFIFVIGLSDLFGVAPVKSFWSNFERMEGYITMLHLGAYFLVIGSIFKEREWRWWWNTSLIASFLMVLYCVGQVLGALTIHQGGVRLDGTFGNASYLAVYMLFHIFIALIYLMKSKRNSLLWWAYSLLILSETCILYLTATRGAILGLLGGVVVVALLNIKSKESKLARRASMSIILSMLLIVAGFYAVRNSNFVKESPVLSRFSNTSLKEFKTEGRSFIWPMAVKGILEKPILGWGQDNFNYVFNEHYDPRMYGQESWFDRAHNIFLDWGVAGGLLGMIGYLSLYVALLYIIWKKDHNLSHLEKSLFTGLIAAYFFHNLFVFDQIVSYILFLSLLAHMHSRAASPIKRISNLHLSMDRAVVLVALPVSLILLFVLYTVNIRPMMASVYLIKGLEVSQAPGADKNIALEYFKKAYASSRLGRPEVVEWTATSAGNLNSSNLSDEDKTKYLLYAKKITEDLAALFPTDTRYQILAGTYLTKIGYTDEGFSYLEKARELTPGKQIIYFETGAALVDKGDYKGALEVFKQAYDLEPDNKEARLIYMVGAIYAGDSKLFNDLSKTLSTEDIASDPRIANALLDTKNFKELIDLLKINLELNPKNPQAYASLSAAYMKAGDKEMAIKILKELGDNVPSLKPQADKYIEQIKNGTIK